MSLVAMSAQEIGVLKNSLVFAMSLGARELFHTNFLAFLLESDDEDLVPIQDAIRKAMGWLRDPNDTQVLSRCAVWREKNNLDLVIVELRAEEAGARPTGRVLVVEAKLKSIPEAGQLARYDGKAIELNYPEGADRDDAEWSLLIKKVGAQGVTVKVGDKRRVVSVTPDRRLLSIEGRTLNSSDGTVLEWQGVSWDDLRRGMARNAGQVKSPVFGRILPDYLESLEALVGLIRHARTICDEACQDGSQIKYGYLRNQALAPQFHKLRINDLLGKALFEYWLNKYIFPAVPKEKPQGWSFEKYVNYSRGTPGFGIELVQTRENPKVTLGIGIQLQNCEFRVYVVAKPEYPNLDQWIKDHPILLGKWFGVPLFDGRPPVGRDGKPLMPGLQKERFTNLKIFGVTKFLYSKVDIDEETIGDVQKEVVRMLTLACELVPQL